MSNPRNLAIVRWGILGTGTISTLFAKDLLASREDPTTPVHHVVHGIATSSRERREAFIRSATFAQIDSPIVYTNHEDLYADSQIDIVYVGLPHHLHKSACLAAMTVDKHVLCEKPMTINLREFDEVVALAKEKRTFLMEGVWTRFLPLVQELQRLIHEEKVIGHIHRMYCDFSCDVKMENLPPTSRLKDPNQGGGALLDLGVYPITLSNLILDTGVGDSALYSEVKSSLTVVGGIDYSDAIVVNYPSKGCLAILTASLQTDRGADFCRIEGTEGVVTLFGSNAAKPETIGIQRHGEPEEELSWVGHPGTGLYFEANAAAMDFLAGRAENSRMPWAETRRVMEILDGIRRSAQVVYPQDMT